jgi:glycerol uptake facilitator-like aquaporin
LTGNIDWRKPAAEFLGTAFLLAAIVGSGIMAERLSAGNAALALLANSVATGAALFALIHAFAPISGAHFNPAVTFTMAAARAIERAQVLPYVLAQTAGAIVGVWVAHLMFDIPILQTSTHARTGIGQWTGEFVATFGLIAVIENGRRRFASALPAAVALYITAAYWFTSSTSFANPAVTLARALTDTFAGIAPIDVMAFVVAQAIGAIAALFTVRALNKNGHAADTGLASAAFRQQELAKSSDV